MNAHRKNAPPHAVAAESVVYLGRDAVGSILVVRKGQVTATDAAGRRIGVYRTDREAMTAILTAARKAREELR